MEMQEENQRLEGGQLISVPHKDTIRLLEVYVKRSLSMNDGFLGDKRPSKKEKWVTMAKRHRRHSSDPSLHLAEGLSDEEIGVFSVVEPPNSLPETCPEEPEKPKKKKKKKKKKTKKPSLWKSFVGLFSPKSSKDKEEDKEEDEEDDSPPDMSEPSAPATPVTLRKKSMKRKSLRRRFSKKRLSLIKINKPGKDLNPDDITGVEAVISVEPTYSYYEKVTEELEKIVHEVKDEAKPLSDEEVLERIIALTKEQGDAINGKLRENPTLSNFFQGMTYSSFQKLADDYLQKEAPPIHNPPTVLPTAPELVKLAFTLDFTARIAGLSRQSVGHITGLGNRYLQDRFKYRQACTDHPWSDSDD
ncbi:uncharacterized protein LOC110955583 [Acanthochromis polyacanthus]|uniref:uncharacterized protein LOC110955583 n=1 Tax=Acanthochromis polyacanthus TaxID=80966 RepID=UPI000B9008CA|nr:uncharacterized protein LOC110955583 [Acanthochromis polyacanthus]